MQVGTTKDQGLYNKPSAAVHPRELTAGTLPEYNTIQYIVTQESYYYVFINSTYMATGFNQKRSFSAHYLYKI